MLVLELVAAMFLQLMSPSSSPRIADSPDITHERMVRGICWSLLQRARAGASRYEQAAFLIRNAEGAIFCAVWPDASEPDSQRWDGAIPSGTIAIIHTHPNWMPMPSRIDMRTAKTRGIPVYVVTVSQIAKTSGGDPEVVVAGPWKPDRV